VETRGAIRARRNVRSYADEAIAPKDLDRILEAARRTPSAGNQQAWDFVHRGHWWRPYPRGRESADVNHP
jgi:nitroreductase